MKLTLKGQRTEQIAAGVEPWDTAEVEIDLTTLTPDQRGVIADGRDMLTAIEATPEAAIDALDRALARRRQEALRARERAAAAEAEVRATMEARTLRETVRHVETVRLPHWEVPVVHIHQIPAAGELAAEVRAQTAALDAEAERLNAGALAVAAPAIEAAKAERIAQEAVVKGEEAAAKAARFARRLETGIVEIPFPRDDRREWGEPWIAKLSPTTNGKRPDYDFSQGAYIAATETLTIPCKPGEMIAYGQKNYKKDRRTVHEVRRERADGGLDQV